MKLHISLSLILITILGCKTQKSETTLSGHWYACAYNGDYIEMHFKENKYRFSADFMDPTHWNSFETQGDTLIQYDKFLIKDSTVISKAIFRFPSKNELKLEYLTSNDNWTFYKIADNEIVDIENDSILKKETLERSKTRKCEDKRTDEEKAKDSVGTFIDFQF